MAKFRVFPEDKHIGYFRGRKQKADRLLWDGLLFLEADESFNMEIGDREKYHVFGPGTILPGLLMVGQETTMVTSRPARCEITFASYETWRVKYGRKKFRSYLLPNTLFPEIEADYMGYYSILGYTRRDNWSSVLTPVQYTPYDFPGEVHPDDARMVAEEVYPRENYPEITELAMTERQFKDYWSFAYDGYKIIDKS